MPVLDRQADSGRLPDLLGPWEDLCGVPAQISEIRARLRLEAIVPARISVPTPSRPGAVRPNSDLKAGKRPSRRDSPARSSDPMTRKIPVPNQTSIISLPAPKPTKSSHKKQEREPNSSVGA